MTEADNKNRNSIGPDASARRIIAIGAGKGGAGSSIITANLAVFLAQIGKRVTVVDANIFEPGIHTWLGMEAPDRTLADVRNNNLDKVTDALVDTPITGLSLLSATPDLLSSLQWPGEMAEWMIRQIRKLETEFVLIDLCSGTHPLSLDIFTAADVPVLVSVAEPDAVETTYRFWMAAFTRKLLKSSNIDEASTRIIRQNIRHTGPTPSARQILDELEETESEFLETARNLHSRFHPQLIVNQIRVKSDESLGEAMVSAATRWLGLLPQLLGSVEWDDNVWLSQRRGIPLLIDFPQSRACKGLERVVRKLLGQELDNLYAPEVLPPPTGDQNLYELLEIYPGASEEEVRRGLKRVRDLFSTRAVAVRGACNEGARQEYQRRAEDAHATLVDKSKRREYDRETFPDGFPSRRETFGEDISDMTTKPPRPHDSLPDVEVSDDQVVDGRFLGQIRRDRGVDLVDISNRAKISISYLRAVEEERWEELPAPVYIRGFITEFSRYLKIDSRRAVNDFLAKYESHQKRKKK